LPAHSATVPAVLFGPEGKLLLRNTKRLITVLAVSFSPDGKRLASAGDDGMVRVWDTVTGQEALSLKGHTGTVTSVAFSPDGKRLASADSTGRVKVWDATPLPEARPDPPAPPRP